MQGHLLQTELWSPENQNDKISLQLFAYFSVLKISVDLLRFVEQIQHLPQSKLKIHVSEMENPSKILKKKIYETYYFLLNLFPNLVPFCGGRHAAGSVGCWCWKRGLYSTGGDFRGTGGASTGLAC